MLWAVVAPPPAAAPAPRPAATPAPRPPAPVACRAAVSARRRPPTPLPPRTRAAAARRRGRAAAPTAGACRAPTPGAVRSARRHRAPPVVRAPGGRGRPAACARCADAVLVPGAEYFLPTPYPPDTDLRIEALNGLLEAHSERVIPLLREIALDGNNPDEARRAVLVLARSHRPEARTDRRRSGAPRPGAGPARRDPRDGPVRRRRR